MKTPNIDTTTTATVLVAQCTSCLDGIEGFSDLTDAQREMIAHAASNNVTAICDGLMEVARLMADNSHPDSNEFAEPNRRLAGLVAHAAEMASHLGTISSTAMEASDYLRRKAEREAARNADAAGMSPLIEGQTDTTTESIDATHAGMPKTRLRAVSDS